MWAMMQCVSLYVQFSILVLFLFSIQINIFYKGPFWGSDCLIMFVYFLCSESEVSVCYSNKQEITKHWLYTLYLNLTNSLIVSFLELRFWLNLYRSHGNCGSCYFHFMVIFQVEVEKLGIKMVSSWMFNHYQIVLAYQLSCSVPEGEC